jgi:hypothetical protein
MARREIKSEHDFLLWKHNNGTLILPDVDGWSADASILMNWDIPFSVFSVIVTRHRQKTRIPRKDLFFFLIIGQI